MTKINKDCKEVYIDISNNKDYNLFNDIENIINNGEEFFKEVLSSPSNLDNELDVIKDELRKKEEDFRR